MSILVVDERCVFRWYIEDKDYWECRLNPPNEKGVFPISPDNCWCQHAKPRERFAHRYDLPEEI